LTLEIDDYTENSIKTDRRDLIEFSEQEIALADSRRPIVEAMLAKKGRTGADVEKAGQSLGISGRRLYIIMWAYRDNPTIEALIGKKRGRKKGSRQLSPEVEAIITDAIETKYKKKTRPGIHYVVRHIHAECHMRGLPKPAPNTIKSRINALDDREVSSAREGYYAARDKYSPINQGFETPRFVMDCVMIDHTPADVIVVDEESRLPIGRPYITLAVDVRSRAILAFIIRLSAPSSLTNGLALHMCSLPKDKWLADRNINTSWPMFGIPSKLSLDNGSDFTGNALKFGCQQYLINIDHRPIKHPTTGGIIERAIQTVNRETHQLPGTTKGNVVSKREYNAEKEACMTLKEVEKYLVLFITEQYHERIQEGIGISPRRAWEEGIANDQMFGPSIRTPNDPRRFLIDFLPYENLPITRKGFNYKGVYYNDPALTKLRLKDGKRKYAVRRDPRAIKTVFAYIDSLNPPRYLEVRAVDKTLPNISEEEFKDRKQKQKAIARSGINYDLIHKAHLRGEKIVAEAEKETKTARKKRAKKNQNKKSVQAIPTSSVDVKSKESPAITEVQKFDSSELENFLDDGFDEVDLL